MRRPALTVQTSTGSHNSNVEYEYTQALSNVRESCDSDHTSTYTDTDKKVSSGTEINSPCGDPVIEVLYPSTLKTYTPPKPSFWLLFSFLSRRDLVTLILPAICLSLFSGGIAPFMTLVVGSVFDAFARFPLSSPTQEQKSELVRSIGLSSLELLALGVGAVALGSATSAMWITTGERNVLRIRMQVYSAVSERDMEG